MNTTILPIPTPDDFNHFSDIFRRQADSREALSAALQSVLGDDLGLADEAATLRSRAQNSRQHWPSLVADYGPSGAGTMNADPVRAGGFYGRLIVNAATTKLVAIACCDQCRSALMRSSIARRDFSVWVGRHIQFSQWLAERAHLDALEADHLNDLANSLEAESLEDAPLGQPR